MRRFAAPTMVALILASLVAAPAPAAARAALTGLSVSSLTISPSKDGVQVINVEPDEEVVTVSFNPGPFFLNATRDGTRCPNNGVQVICQGAGDITIQRSATPNDPSLHNSDTAIGATAGGQSASGVVRIRFQSDISISAASYNVGSAGTSQFRTTWSNGGPHAASGVTVRVRGLKAGATLPGGCSRQGSDIVCSGGNPGTFTFTMQTCPSLTPVDVTVSAAPGNDTTPGNNSWHVDAPFVVCPTSAPPTTSGGGSGGGGGGGSGGGSGGGGSGGGGGGAGGGGGGGGGNTTDTASPVGPTIVDGTTLPGLTVIPGPAGHTEAAPTDGRVPPWVGIIGAIGMAAALVLAGIGAWWYRAQRRATDPEPW